MRMLESGRVPDWLIRNRIRALLAERLREEDKGDPERQQAHLMDLVRRLSESPIAVNTAEARPSAAISSTRAAITIPSTSPRLRAVWMQPRRACWR